MSMEKELDELPWDVVKEIQFSPMKILITFESGRKLKAQAPNFKAWEEFFKKAKEILEKDQIIIRRN